MLTAPGTVRYLSRDIPMCCVAGVTTSRVARKQGFASRLTARCIARDVADGAQVASLGMFEQGYYDQLGFGTGAYEHLVTFDPTQLRADLLPTPRVPRRLTADDWEAVHTARLARHRGHGGCNLEPAALTHGEMLESKSGFGLGYGDGPGGALSHLIWFTVPDDVEVGPYRVEAMIWRTPEQLLELLALVRAQGDQVRMVRMREPAGVQLQDLMRKPFHHMIITRKGEFENRTWAVAYWQMRICDVIGCMANTRLPFGGARFNLKLTDPIEALLDDGQWCGVTGEYVVTLGTCSGAEAGTDGALPTLHASVNAFTRMWLGVRPASGLALTDNLDGPPELLGQLDEVLRLPDPHPDWDF